MSFHGNPYGIQKDLLTEFPGGTVLGVLDKESEFGKGIANLVACGPVLGSLCLCAQVEKQVDGSTEGGFALCIAVVLTLETEDVEAESMEHLGEGFESLGGDGLLPVDKTVDDAAGIEKVADADGAVEVVVHRLVALLLEFLCIFDSDGGLLAHRLDAFKLLDGIHQAVEALLGSLQGIVAEVDGRTVVGLEEEEADGHRGVCLLEEGMVSGEELVEGDEVVVRLAHLLPGNGNHVVVHPILYHGMSLACHSLCDFALMVGEHKVHAASVDVELLAEVLASHGRTLAVPSGESLAPWRGPAHDVLGLCLLPERKVHLVLLLAHTVEFAAGIVDILKVASGKDAVLVVLVVFHDVEI